MKLVLRILPWFLSAFFLFLWQASKIDAAITNHYTAQSHSAAVEDVVGMKSYIIKSRGFGSDLVAFQSLNMIADNQYDGKYLPWLRTELGLVNFDEDGFIVAICDSTVALGSEDCPPQL